MHKHELEIRMPVIVMVILLFGAGLGFADFGPKEGGWGFIPDLAATADLIVVGHTSPGMVLVTPGRKEWIGTVDSFTINRLVFTKTNWSSRGLQSTVRIAILRGKDNTAACYMPPGTNYMVFLRVRPLEKQLATANNLAGQIVYGVWPDYRCLFREPTREQIEAARAFTELRLFHSIEDKIRHLKVLSTSTNALVRIDAGKLLEKVMDEKRHGPEYGRISMKMIRKGQLFYLEGGPLLQDARWKWGGGVIPR
jgi:hypothetical protein